MPKIHLKVREKIFEYEAGLTLETISRDFQKAYPHDIILARVDGKLAELMKTIDEDVSVEFITTGEIIGNEAYRRTASMMMLKAFQDVMGRENFERLTVQYSLDRGYYCELISDTSLTKELLDRVKLRMQEIQKENIPIIKKSMPKERPLKSSGNIKCTIKSICSIIGAVPGSTFILWKIPLTTFTAIWHQIPLMSDILIYTCMTMDLYCRCRNRHHRRQWMPLNRLKNCSMC